MKQKKVKKRDLFFIVLIIAYLIGGSFQILGFITNTQCTIILTALTLFHLLIMGKKFQLNPFLILIALIIASAVANRTSGELGLYYIVLFALVPFAIFHLVMKEYGKLEFKNILNILLFIGMIQLPVILLQRSYFNEIIAVSAKSVSETDIGFGTFFIANDHALGFFLLSLITYLLFDKPPFKPSSIIFFVLWFAVTIVVANSNVSMLLLAAILIIFLLLKSSKVLFPLLILSILALIIILNIPALSAYISDKYLYIYGKILGNDHYSVNQNFDPNYAQRGDILVYYVTQKFKIIGEGPYNYYDPIGKQFKMFQNFSQYLWFYNDLGILGVIGTIFTYTFLYFKYNVFKSYKIIYLVMILVYAYFSNTLSDIAFNLTFSLFILKDVIHKDEHRLHTIPRLA